MVKKKCIIIDLEGTLSDHSHRVHYYDDKNYGRYNQLFMDDLVNKDFLNILQGQRALYDGSIYIVMITAKSIAYREDVLNWLERCKLGELVDYIYYRGKLDSRPSVQVKKELLAEVREKFVVLKAFDDRADICAMFEEEGIKAINVGIKKKSGPAKTLKDAADLYEKRNAEYGDGYKAFGEIMMGLFPEGIEIKNQKDASRFAILNILVAKLDRYCKNFTKGGHQDSLKDISVYAAMLMEVDDGS